MKNKILILISLTIFCVVNMCLQYYLYCPNFGHSSTGIFLKDYVEQTVCKIILKCFIKKTIEVS